jgi:hypothetical protein
MQPRNMFSVKFGGSQTQGTNEMDGNSLDPNQQYVNYQIDPNCRKDLPENYMADGTQFTMGVNSQQEL